MPKIKREVFSDVTPLGRTNRFLNDQSLDALRQKHRDRFEERHPDILEEFRSVHGDKYDYSLVEYRDSSTKLRIICPLHGEFRQRFHNHLRGGGCKECARDRSNKSRRVSTEELVRRFVETHGDCYDYSKVSYDPTCKKVVIICPKHGEFQQNPWNHQRGARCPQCSRQTPSSQRKSRLEVIEEFIRVHGQKYDYSRVDYVRTQDPVVILCRMHGEFHQTPLLHKQGAGCPKCWQARRGKNQVLTNEQVVDQFREIHGTRYNYEKVEYKGAKSKVLIICPLHGEFYQTPSNHKRGSGCRQCGQMQRVGHSDQFKP